MGLEPTQRLEILESLVEELIKDQPDQGQVKECMNQVGIPYSENAIECINRVLSALHAKGKNVEVIHEEHR